MVSGRPNQSPKVMASPGGNIHAIPLTDLWNALEFVLSSLVGSRISSSPDRVGKVAHLVLSGRLPQPHGLNSHCPITHARASGRRLLCDGPHARRPSERLAALHGSKPPDAAIFAERDPSGRPCSCQESGRRRQI